VALLASPDAGTLIRVIAGSLPTGDGTIDGPGSTHTPITMVHATLAPGARLELPWRGDFNALAYGLIGEGSVGAEARPFGLGRLAVFDPAGARAGSGGPLVFTASPAQPLDVLILGGRPLREPVAAYGPFVMNDREQLVQAFEDYQGGRLGTVPADGLRPYRR
jgi:redox-sensitive bicupin YhaK (pirin superfamily)